MADEEEQPLEERLEEAMNAYREFMEEEAPNEDDYDLNDDEQHDEFEELMAMWDDEFRTLTDALEEALEEARATNSPDDSNLGLLIIEGEALLNRDEPIPEQHAGRKSKKSKSKKGKTKKSKSKKSKKGKARKTRRRLV